MKKTNSERQLQYIKKQRALIDDINSKFMLIRINRTAGSCHIALTTNRFPLSNSLKKINDKSNYRAYLKQISLLLRKDLKTLEEWSQ